MSKTCFYRMTYDGGSAPNPFHGWCTLAICTPNHMRARLVEGDYIAGVEGVGLRQRRIRLYGGDPADKRLRLLYIMRVEDVLCLNDYYLDPRFESKKVPSKSTDPKRLVGDNLYCLDAAGAWTPTVIPQAHADSPKTIAQDHAGNRVFVGTDFVYFGREGIPLSDGDQEFVPGRGLKYMRESSRGDALFQHARAAAGGKLVGMPIDMQVGDRSC